MKNQKERKITKNQQILGIVKSKDNKNAIMVFSTPFAMCNIVFDVTTKMSWLVRADYFKGFMLNSDKSGNLYDGTKHLCETANIAKLSVYIDFDNTKTSNEIRKIIEEKLSTNVAVAGVLSSLISVPFKTGAGVVIASALLDANVSAFDISSVLEDAFSGATKLAVSDEDKGNIAGYALEIDDFLKKRM